MFSLTLRFPLFVLALLFTAIWGLACFINLSLKHDLERLLSTSAVLGRIRDCSQR
jgi:hypothetical protein